MIISNSHRFIFVHVHKTGGTTVCAALDASLRWNDLMLGGTAFGEQLNGPYRERHGLRKHSTAREIRAIVGDAVWSSYFTFTFVRHPYARAVSHFRWLGQRLRGDPRPDSPMRTWPTMQAFVDVRDFSEFIRHEKFLASDAARPQWDAISDESGAPMVDFVGRVEEFDASMRAVTSRLGIPWRTVERRNRSDDAAQPGEPTLREEDYAHLARLFRADFERLRYDPSVRLPDVA